MQITLLFALLPLLAGIAQAQSQPGLDIRVVKDNSKRGSDDILARRAGENVVKSYAQCEQVCRAYFEPSDTPATEKAEPTVAQFAQSSAKSRRIATSTAAAVATSAAKPSSSDAAPPTANVNSAASTTDEQRMLTEHNTFRAKYGAQALTWNATLATYAKEYASKCVFEHSKGPYGENLAASGGRSDPIGTGLTSWEQESSKYDYNNPTFGSGTGHFTQMVWKSTSQLGCALVSCGPNTVLQGFSSSSSYVICEYYPPGNVLGNFDKQVGRPVA